MNMSKKQQGAKAQEAFFQELAQASFENEVLTERMAELELALEDANWMRLMMEGQQEFSRDGLRKIVELARMMFIKNPLVNRAVLVQALYVWGQGVTVKFKDPILNKVLQAFWDDEKNRAEWTSHQAQIYKEYDLRVEGNIFFVFFTRPTDGRVRVRTLPFDEISEIISDPEDSKSPRYYVRQWTEKRDDARYGTGYRTVTRKACYPYWKYNPITKPQKVRGMDVHWDTPAYHVRTGGMSNWKFGVSEIYQAVDWARAYKEFLEDVASLMRAYSRFAWKRVTKGGKKAIAAERAKMATTLASGGTSTETNPSPVTGAMAILGEGTDLQPMQLRGAAISADDGRRFLLMVAAAVGLSETYFGDVSVGTFATAKTMDRPTELAMKERQTMWTDIIRAINNFVMLQAAKYNTEVRALCTVKKEIDGDEIEEGIQWNSGVNTMQDIDFPPILEKDIQTSVQAVVTALTLNGQEIINLIPPEIGVRLILSALGQDDIDEIMAEIFPDDTTMPAGKGTLTPTPTLPQGGGGSATPSEARIKEAARRFLEAVKNER
jgi:hypothetical protein